MKHQIENIFSKTKPQKEPTCPNPKIPIIIDTREKQSLISANLVEKKANIQFEKLEIGDYLVGETIIERKTFQDLVGSMINKRLFDQIHEIKKYPKHFLIIENFYYNYNKFNIHENAIRGMLLSIATDFQVPIIFTENEEDTSKFLILLAKRYEKPNIQNAIRQTKTQKTIEQQKEFILEGFPEIGPTAAKKLLENFSNLKQIFNTTEKELKQIGLSEIQIKKFLQLLN
ncbi:MAG: ERCC4 domain-containing protein [archaeon]